MLHSTSTRPEYRLTAEQAATIQKMDRRELNTTKREHAARMLQATLQPGDVVEWQRTVYSPQQWFRLGTMTVKKVNNDGTVTMTDGQRFAFDGVHTQYCNTVTPKDRPTITLRRLGSRLDSRTVYSIQPAATTSALAKIATVAATAVQLALFA